MNARWGSSTLDKPRILYICSAARCGSTITDMLLGGHPDVASLGEINQLGKSIKLGQDCTCGAKVRDCTEWSKVYRAIEKETGIYPPARPYAYRLWDIRAVVIKDPEYQDWLFHLRFALRRAWLGMRECLPDRAWARFPLLPSQREALANKMRLYDMIGAAWNKRVIVDSSKNPWEAVELATRYPEQVRVILLSRDGRGVYFSRRTSGFNRQASLKGWMKYYGRSTPMLRRHVPAENLLQVSYEDMASDPARIGRAICEFAGIPFDPAMLDLGKGDRHMVNGNDTRFAPARGIRLDERWRRELAEEELAYFERHAGMLNRRLGYTEASR